MSLDIKTAALLFKALADPTRLRILALLQTGSLCVMDIVKILSLPQPMISRHLAYLQKKGILKGEKKGLWHFYTLNRQSPVTQPFQTLLKTHSLSSLKQDQQKTRVLRRKGGCCPK